MHMFSKERRFFGGHGIVGAQVSLGTGLAISQLVSGQRPRVGLTYFGEGCQQPGPGLRELQPGGPHEAAGASIVIENNKYGMGTSVERASASHDLSKNGAPWGIPGVQVDGMDVAGGEGGGRDLAVAHCRAGNGPYLLEVKTYRYRGHSMSDPAQVPLPRRGAEDAQRTRLHRGGAARLLVAGWA